MKNAIDEDDDPELVEAARAGDRRAISALVALHRPWLYNVALKMVWEPAVAEDVTQDVLVQLLRGLSGFEGRSSLKTWLYRIALHRVMNMRRSGHEVAAGPFEEYGRRLNAIADRPLADMPAPERELLVNEMKVACLSGMLLCLSREQRAAYVLGSVFEVSDATAAEILGITPDTFRKRLSRARADLHAFMDGQCGLVREENPCRCANKTRSFVERGLLDPRRLLFHRDYRQHISEVATRGADGVFKSATEVYPRLFREHPFSDPPATMDKVLRALAGTPLEGVLGGEPDAP